MTEWRIYYGDGSVVYGRTLADWTHAPADDVQVVVLMEPYPDRDGQPWRPWAGVSDRQFWTGQDTYALHGWPLKRGAWMDDAAYHAVWERARTD